MAEDQMAVVGIESGSLGDQNNRLLRNQGDFEGDDWGIADQASACNHLKMQASDRGIRTMSC